MPDSRQASRLSLLRMEATFAGIALCFPVLEWFFQQHITAKDFFLEWFFSFIYANCIGLVMTVAVPRTFVATEYLAPWLRWSVRAGVIAVITCVGCLIAGLVPHLMMHNNYWASFQWTFGISLLIAIICTAVISSFEELNARLRVTQLELRTKELERERALKLATEARLASLESRIHPHFLFNTINSVSSLIHEDPNEAEKLLIQMSNLLRFSLDSGHVGLVPLDREMKIVKDYLEIEKARFNGRLRYQITVADHLNNAPVPPLSIQTLVENSVKYAVAPRREGASIIVMAQSEEDRILLEVCDDGPGFADGAFPAGHGLSNLKERLQALYGSAAMLHVGSIANGACVRLLVPVSR